jgi:hypothetical protein
MVTVVASRKSAAAYKKLLLTEWTDSLVASVLDLQWRTTKSLSSPSLSAPSTLQDMLSLLNPTDEQSLDSEEFNRAVNRIREGTRFIRLADLPEITSRSVPAKRHSSSVREARKLAVYLTLSAHTAVTGDTDFLRDMQSLAFQAAIHFALPAAKQKRAHFEHALLLHSAVLFCAGYAAEDPGHSSYMMSQVHDYLGDEQRRLSALFAAYRFTSLEDHSYLTKAQEYWSALLDHQRFEEAEKFLLSLQWWSLPAHQDEVREMVVTGFKQILSTQHK